MRAFFYLIKMRLLISLTYRFEVISSLLSNFVILLTSLFLWKAAYRGVDSVEGVTERGMITYAIMAAFLGSLFTNSVYYTMRDRIDRGEIGTYFIRPFNIVFSFLAEDLGQIFSSFLFQVLPLLLTSVFIIRSLPLPAGGRAFVLFLISSVFSYGILWLLSLLVSLCLFWFINLGNMNFVKDVIVRILSGSIVPLWFFPDWFNTFSNYLPFKYTFQTPLAIYIGKLSYKETLFALLLQSVWILILSLCAFFLWNRGKEKVMVQGG